MVNFNTDINNYIENKTEELYKVANKSKKATNMQKIQLINAYIKIWSEFNETMTATVGGYNIIYDYIDPNENELSKSKTLKMKYILCKENGKLNRFSGIDRKLNYLKLYEIAEYSLWIIGQTFKDNNNNLDFFYLTYLQTCLLAFKSIDLTPMNITPKLILKVIMELQKNIIKEVKENNGLMKRPAIRVNAPCFTVDDPKAISKATGEYRQKKVIEWLCDYYISFKEKYDRFPCVEEVQAHLQVKFNEADKDFKLFMKKGAVARNTLYKWLDAAEVRNLTTRKTKDLELHIDE